MIIISHRALPIALSLLLAGCSGAGEQGNTTADGVARTVDTGRAGSAQPPATAAVPDTGNMAAAENAVAGGTIGGDGSQITLDPLSRTDVAAAKLEGELGCSFAQSSGSPILVAMGNVASAKRSQGVVKVAGYVEEIGAPGGFDAMTKGTSFAGKGKTIRIAITGAATGGGESPPKPATLTYDRADGAKRVIAGNWTCGP
jgi:hypothetical protein